MFSDIINVLIFSGEVVVTWNSLKDLMGMSQYKADDSKIHEQERDIYKIWEKEDVAKIMFGIENQTEDDRDMPFRVIGYDGSSYRSQLLKISTDNENGSSELIYCKERYPVVTLVLYYGKKKWRYSNELLDYFMPDLSSNEILNRVCRFISNYKINIFDIGSLSGEELNKFTSDFKLVAEYFVNMRNNIEDYIPSNQGIVHVDEFLKLMSVLTGDSRYEEYIYLYTEEEKNGGNVNMCKLLDAREDKGKTIGRKEGRKEGEQRLLILIDRLISDNRMSEIANISSNDELRKNLYFEYGL